MFSFNWHLQYLTKDKTHEIEETEKPLSISQQFELKGNVRKLDWDCNTKLISTESCWVEKSLFDGSALEGQLSIARLELDGIRQSARALFCVTSQGGRDSVVWQQEGHTSLVAAMAAGLCLTSRSLRDLTHLIYLHAIHSFSTSQFTDLTQFSASSF